MYRCGYYYRLFLIRCILPILVTHVWLQSSLGAFRAFLAVREEWGKKTVGGMIGQLTPRTGELKEPTAGLRSLSDVTRTMPPVFPPTALDQHNMRERAARAAATTSVPSVSTGLKFDDVLPKDPKLLGRLADAVARRRHGMTIFYGMCENAAAAALDDLIGYVAIVNGEDCVWIDEVDQKNWVVRGVFTEAGSTDRFEDQPFEISLNDIKSISV